MPSRWQEDKIIIRRAAVMRLLAMGKSQREIQHDLAKPSKKTGLPTIVNPETGEPYGIGTINRDVQYLRDYWREQQTRSVNEWVAEELQLLNQLQQMAMAEKDYKAVLSISKRRADMLGLDAPIRAKFTHETAITLSDETLRALEALGFEPVTLSNFIEDYLVELLHGDSEPTE